MAATSAFAAAARRQGLAARTGQCDKDKAGDQHVGGGEFARQVDQIEHEEGPDEGTENRSCPAKKHPEEWEDRILHRGKVAPA